MGRAMTATDIKAFRDALGLTQEELAERIGVTHSAISQWESGKKKPRPVVLKMLTYLRDEAAGRKKRNAS